MTDDTDLESLELSLTLKGLPQKLLAARLEVARIRKRCSVADITLGLAKLLGKEGKPGAVPSRSYYSHESWDANARRPKLGRLRVYAELLDVPLDYLLLGKDAHIYEDEARKIAARTKTKLKIDDLPASSRQASRPQLIYDTDSKVNDDGVNQTSDASDTGTIHNTGVRFIVIATASEIRKLKQGRGVPADMAGPSIPVPDFLKASRHTFGYEIPNGDNSMTAPTGLSFNAGGVCYVDPQAEIRPGQYVLARLKDADEPVIRQFQSSLPYADGRMFELHALNPAYKPIAVTAKDDCAYIARVIFFGNVL